MKVKIFYPNEEGKIEFTKEELEKLIDEVYEEGRVAGVEVGKSNVPFIPYSPYPNSPITWTYPPITVNTTPLTGADTVYYTGMNEYGRTSILTTPIENLSNILRGE